MSIDARKEGVCCKNVSITTNGGLKDPDMNVSGIFGKRNEEEQIISYKQFKSDMYLFRYRNRSYWKVRHYL